MILPSKLPPKIRNGHYQFSTVALAVILIAILIDYGIVIDGIGSSDAAQNIRSAVNLARFGEYGTIAVGVEAGFLGTFSNFLLFVFKVRRMVASRSAQRS